MSLSTLVLAVVHSNSVHSQCRGQKVRPLCCYSYDIILSHNCLSLKLDFVSAQKIMAYSNSSRKGRAFLRYLTDLSVRATLFAPNDSGLRENQARVLSLFFLHFNSTF